MQESPTMTTEEQQQDATSTAVVEAALAAMTTTTTTETGAPDSGDAAVAAEDDDDSVETPNEDVCPVHEAEVSDAMGRKGIYTGPLLVSKKKVQVHDNHNHDDDDDDDDSAEIAPDNDDDAPDAIKPIFDGVPHGSHGVMLYFKNENDNNNNAMSIVKYSGDWKNGHWHGQGDLMLGKGDIYKGQFSNSKRQGMGSYTWSDGRHYIGEYHSDQRHGQGTYTWPPATTNSKTATVIIYQGGFCANQRQGHGVYRDDGAGLLYEGEWKGGKYEGRGKYSWKDPITGESRQFEGLFHAGQPARAPPPASAPPPPPPPPASSTPTKQPPPATETTSEDESSSAVTVVENQVWIDPTTGRPVVYRGLWNPLEKCPVANGLVKYDVNITFGHESSDQTTTGMHFDDRLSYDGWFDHGTYHGHGRLTWRNGDCYEGDFEHGKRTGFGIYRWKDGRQYQGAFVQNQRQGQGTYAYPNGDFYQGTFLHGKRHGQGRFVFNNGSVYQGEWKAGVYDGTGSLVQSNGNTYEGEFQAGLYHGTGTETNPKGKVLYQGAWRLGQRTEHFESEEDEEETDSHVAEVQVSEPPRQEQPDQSACPSTMDPFVQRKTSTGTASVPGAAASPGRGAANRPIVHTTQQKPTPAVVVPSASSSNNTAASNLDDCQAVVDCAVVDSQGNPGTYTGIVLRPQDDATLAIPHGVGRMVYSDGKRIHEGFWNQGSKEGHGRCLFFPQGDYHEGLYHGNLRHGPGRYQWKDGRLYQGQYVNDARQGPGTFSYPSGESYKGEFSNGQRWGLGKFQFAGPEGYYYQGEWEAGKYHGQGKLVWNGIVFEGGFRQGMFHGQGVRKQLPQEQPDGAIEPSFVVDEERAVVVQQGTWVDGRFQTKAMMTEDATIEEKKEPDVKQTGEMTV